METSRHLEEGDSHDETAAADVLQPPVLFSIVVLDRRSHQMCIYTQHSFESAVCKNQIKQPLLCSYLFKVHEYSVPSPRFLMMLLLKNKK